MGTVMRTRRGGGGGGAGTLYGFDFTALNDAQLQAAGWSWSRDNPIWVPDSAGDYAEIAAGVMAKSDLGVMCFGGFTNYAPNGLLDGAVAGSPGTLPTHYYNDPTYQGTLVSVAIDTYFGLPRISITRLSNSNAEAWAYTNTPNPSGSLVGSTSGYASAEAISGAWSASYPVAIINGQDGSYQTKTLAADMSRFDLHCTIGEGATYFFDRHGGIVTAADAETLVRLAGAQLVTLPINPSVLALSSGATTVTASQIPVLSRVTPGECSFVLPVVTSPGRKGTDDVIASASLDANNQLLVVHENADNNILLRLVTAGTTVGERDLGVVGDNVYTVISGSVSIGRLAGALEGMEDMLEITGSGIIPPPAFTRWTLGNDHIQAAGTQFWGSVLGLRIN